MRATKRAARPWRRRRRTDPSPITIVGVDEADIETGLVSWISPIAKAPMKARAGDTVPVRTPGGTERVEVVAIRYGT